MDKNKRNKIIKIIVLSLLLVGVALVYVKFTNKYDPNIDVIEEDNAYYFRNEELLNQHYEKHGKEMGFADAKEYEKAASDVINNPDALSKHEKEDNDLVFFIEDTGEFVVLSTDEFIRTYFIASKKYYDKQ